MKRAGFVLTVAVILALAVSISFNTRTARAQTVNYDIASVNHKVEVLYNGYILLNDTVRISTSDQAPTEFLIGFPHKYGSYVLRSIAYDTANPSDVFSVDLNVPLDGHIGYYGAKVNFPSSAPETFTIAFILSNDLLTQSPVNGSTFTLDFPAYPSLTETAAVCNSSIVLPFGTKYLEGTVGSFVYRQENLTAFTYQPASVTFMVTGEKIRLVDVDELKREITIDELGKIYGSDTYRITNKEPSLTSVQVVLPPNASSPRASDQFGRPFSASPTLVDQATNRYMITLNDAVDRNESTIFAVSYRLPSDVYLKQQGDANDFLLTFPLFSNVNYLIEAASASFVLPEGGQIRNLENVVLMGDYSVSRSAFQESLSIGKDQVIFLDNSYVEIAYTYNPLWLSFRPTLWIWALAMVGVAVVVFWRRPTGPVSAPPVPTVAVRLTADSLKSFVDAYDEKRKINSELASLEARVQKGRIPRRRYKVQKVTLETRLNALSRNLTELKERLHSAGGKYAELIHQLEIAETEITEVEANMKSIESRHSRGEISLEAYRKLLADYQSRREKAETAISGILLRLREEIG